MCGNDGDIRVEGGVSLVKGKVLHWYAAYTRRSREFAVKERLDKLGVENFLPTEELVRETPFGRKKAMVPLIHGMIFIRTDKETSFSLLNDYSLRIVYLKDIEGRHSLIIPDKQMADFMFLLEEGRPGAGGERSLGGFGRGVDAYPRSQAGDYPSRRGRLNSHLLHTGFFFGKDRVRQWKSC